MASLKSLAKETAIYGLSSIVGRFLNYLLVPLYTAKFSVESGGYGFVTNIYSYVALAMVLLTFGMETTFFRFSNKEEENPRDVLSTTLIAVGGVALTFVLLVLTLLNPISSALGYSEHPWYVGQMAICVAVDAFQAILFAYLRYQRRPIKFAALKMLFIVMNIGLNLLYFVAFPYLYSKNPDIIGTIYNPTIGVGYVFTLNLICTLFITIFFIPELRNVSWHFDRALMRRMLSYSWPILILGIAGILNQTADKILFPLISHDDNPYGELAIYGGCSKVAMIMAMITQAFRYAYEPFVFSKSKESDSRETYAKAMRYFVIFTLLAFLTVMASIDILKFVIGRDYWSGLYVIPIVMAAEIMMGIYFNLSFWYKLTDRTIWGAYFSGIGCAALIAINIIFVPRYGFEACAWAGFCGYGIAMLLSYFVGQRYYPINYPLKAIGGYALLAIAIFIVYKYVTFENMWYNVAFRAMFVLIYIGIIVAVEKKNFIHRNVTKNAIAN
ncbi:MAG: lipopolysaccharide biosynthesis protein [Bacteroidales bacterium]|nr:lipopolysaccharide biosynthesis protein [Bacteroidales bacterium]